MSFQKLGVAYFGLLRLCYIRVSFFSESPNKGKRIESPFGESSCGLRAFKIDPFLTDLHLAFAAFLDDGNTMLYFGFRVLWVLWASGEPWLQVLVLCHVLARHIEGHHLGLIRDLRWIIVLLAFHRPPNLTLPP